MIRASDVEPAVWAGGGRGRRMVTLDTAGSKNLVVGIVHVDPGRTVHRWHTHRRDKSETCEIIYPDAFEEVYLIIKGRGTLCWKLNGEERRKEVEEGDAIYFPIGVAENQVQNTGDESMIVVYATTPPARIVFPKSKLGS